MEDTSLFATAASTNRGFVGFYTLKMEPVRSSEALVSCRVTTWRHS